VFVKITWTAAIMATTVTTKEVMKVPVKIACPGFSTVVKQIPPIIVVNWRTSMTSYNTYYPTVGPALNIRPRWMMFLTWLFSDSIKLSNGTGFGSKTAAVLHRNSCIVTVVIIEIQLCEAQATNNRLEASRLIAVGANCLPYLGKTFWGKLHLLMQKSLLVSAHCVVSSKKSLGMTVMSNTHNWLL
jgi:hypothetical protein